MSFTIGTALVDARDHKYHVELLVEGHWIHGEVAAVDGFGVVLSRESTQHSVIRLESIAAINVDEDRAAHRARPQSPSRHMAVAL